MTKAYVKGDPYTYSKSTGTTFAVDMTRLSFVSGDWVLLILSSSRDNSNISLSVGSGWTLITEKTAASTATDGVALCYAVKKMTGTSESDPTFATSNSGTWSAVGVVISGADASTLYTNTSGVGYNKSNTASTKVLTGLTPSVTPTSANTLIITTVACNSAGSILMDANVHTPIVANSAFTVNMAVGIDQHPPTSTATDTESFYSAASAHFCTMTVAINPAASTTGVSRFCRPDLTMELVMGPAGAVVDPSTGFGTAGHDLATLGTALGITQIAGINLSSTVPTISTFAEFTLITRAAASATPEWQGTWGSYSANWQDKLISIVMQFSASTGLSTYGPIIILADSSNNWVAVELVDYSATGIVALLDYVMVLGDGCVTIDSGGTLDWSDIDRYGFAWDSATTSLRTMYVKWLESIGNNTRLFGGTSDQPVNTTFMADTLRLSRRTGLSQLQGENQLLSVIPFQLGNQTDGVETYYDNERCGVELPIVWDGVSQTVWNATTHSTTITLDGVSGDTYLFAAPIYNLGPEQLFNVAATCATDITVDFSGCTLYGFKYTDLAGISTTGGVWSAGDTVVADGDMDGAVVRKTTNATTALTVTGDGATISSTSISATRLDSTSAAYNLTLDTGVTAITLADVTFTGTPGTDKVHVLKTTGTVTITTSGTTSLAPDGSDVTSAGATIVMAVPEVYQEVVVTGFNTGSMIQLYDVDYTFDVSGSPPSIYPSAGDTYTDDTYGYTYTVISAGSGAIHTYGRSSTKTTGTLTRVSGSGDASIDFIGCTDNGEELFKGSSSSGATVISGSTLTWTDPVAAAATRYIRLRRGYVTASDADIWLEKIIGVCGTTSSDNAISYLDAPEEDTVYVTNGKDGPTALASGDYTFTDTDPDLVTLDATGLGGTASWKTIYAVFQAWLSSSTGISDDFAMMFAKDTGSYRCYNTRIKVPLGESLQMTEGFCVDAVTGLSITLWDSTGGSIAFAGEGGYAYSSGSGLSPEQAAELSAAAAKPSAATIATAVWAETLP